MHFKTSRPQSQIFGWRSVSDEDAMLNVTRLLLMGYKIETEDGEDARIYEGYMPFVTNFGDESWEINVDMLESAFKRGCPRQL